MYIPKLIGFLLLIFSANSLPAQFRNIMLDEQTGDSEIICEPVIVINPKRPNNIIAGSAMNNVYITNDGGVTWKKEKLSSSLGAGGNPAIISDSKGNFYYFHLTDPSGGNGRSEGAQSDRIMLQVSDNGGETWSPAEPIGQDPSRHQDKEWAAVDGKGNLYVAWTQFDNYGSSDANCHSRILFSTSRNGKKWSDPVQISQEPGNCLDGFTTRGAVPATFDGKVFVTWSNDGKIFLDRSFNGGDLWLTNDIKVADQKGGWDLRIPGHEGSNGMPVLMVDNSKTTYRGSLYLVWADKSKGEDDADIWFTRSHNFGDNWTPPQRIHTDVKEKHQYMPWMTVDGTTGYIYILYYDRSNYDDHQTDVYLAYSINGGGEFKSVLISEKPFTPQAGDFLGEYNNISAHNGIIAPVWTRIDDGKTSLWAAIIKHGDLVKGK